MRLSLPKSTKTVVKVVSELSSKGSSSENEVNVDEEKEQFFKHGKIPKCCSNKSAKPGTKKRKLEGVSFEFLPEAKRVLDWTNEKYEIGDNYLDKVLGEPISEGEASKYLVEYLRNQSLEGALRIFWSKEINCCGRIIWAGPNARLNKPEKRRYSLWLKSTAENAFLRQHGIKALADHEIGTHYLRAFNDGLQPWFSNRKLFGLRSLNSRHLKVSEEGLAAVNTLLQLNCRLLWWPAFLYYTACMSIKMTFKELFDHLQTYIHDPNQRWKHVMRVKRDLEDCRGYGGSGKDQSYFTGAVHILRNAEDIDFRLLYSGKLCFDELKRVRRVRRASVKLPHFLNDIAQYRGALKEMLHVNGLQPLAIAHCIYRKPTPRKEVAKDTQGRSTSRRSPGKSTRGSQKFRNRHELGKREVSNSPVSTRCFRLNNYHRSLFVRM